MKQSKVLITGASGLVGGYVTPILASTRSDVYVTKHQLSPSKGIGISIDLSQNNQVTEMLKNLEPNVIVNLAALTDVDACESDRDMAVSLNRDLVSALSSYAANNEDVYFLHVSTDYVFDGRVGGYSENSETNPVNWYGKTKLDGEIELRKILRKSCWCIARTSTPFGIHQKKISFPLFVLDNLRKNQSVKALFDQYTSPTYALNLAKMVSEIVERKVSGILHVAGRSRLSRYQQALIIADIFNLDKNLIVRASVEDMKWKAQRPTDSSLSVHNATNILHTKPLEFDKAIAEFAIEMGKRSQWL